MKTTRNFKGLNLHQLKNVINQEKKNRKKNRKLFIFLKRIENSDIYQKQQNPNKVRIHTSDSTGKDLNEVKLHNIQVQSETNEHLLECISLTIKTEGLKKKSFKAESILSFFEQGKVFFYKVKENFRNIHVQSIKSELILS